MLHCSRDRNHYSQSHQSEFFYHKKYHKH